MPRRDDSSFWWIVALSAVVLLTGGAVAYKLARGIRNNNPGNIRKTGIKWQGMAPESEQTDKDFVVFTAPKWGIRAMARDLKTDYAQGQRTVRALINEWAPPVENNTSAYVDAVSRALGVKPDDTLTLSTHLEPLVRAIILHENAVQPYSDETIREGIALA